MAKYGTFKYAMAKYGSYSVLRSAIDIKDHYRMGNIINRVIHIHGHHKFRIKSNSGIYTRIQTVQIQGQVNKLRIKPENGSYIICERKTIN